MSKLSFDLERAQLAEAVHHVRVRESIGRRLGDELIGAAREAVAAYYAQRRIWGLPQNYRLRQAILELEKLVGRP
jgi:hypothetical protein